MTLLHNVILTSRTSTQWPGFRTPRAIVLALSISKSEVCSCAFIVAPAGEAWQGEAIACPPFASQYSTCVPMWQNGCKDAGMYGRGYSKRPPSGHSQGNLSPFFILHVGQASTR